MLTVDADDISGFLDMIEAQADEVMNGSKQTSDKANTLMKNLERIIDEAKLTMNS